MARKKAEGTAPAATRRRRHKDTGAELPAAAPEAQQQMSQQTRPILNAEALGVFDMKPVGPTQIKHLDAIKSNAIDLFNSIKDAEREFGSNRRFSVAITQLEDAVMWANKAVAHKS